MAKTFKNIHAQVAAFGNVWSAYGKARKHKRYKEPAAHFALHLERNLLELHGQLDNRTWRPGPYQHFYIYEPKRRRISAAPFRDRVVHHALVNVLEPLCEARFSVPVRTHAARGRARTPLLRRHTGASATSRTS